MEINLVVILAGVIAADLLNLLTWWLGIPLSSSSHTLIWRFHGSQLFTAIAACTWFSGYLLEDGTTAYWYDIVSWYKAGKTAECLRCVSIILYSISTLVGALMSYLISIWLLNASKKKRLPQTVYLAIMGITIWFVESQMKYYDAIEKPRFDSHFECGF
jgi:PiT family inorganic phosphate transporter